MSGSEGNPREKCKKGGPEEPGSAPEDEDANTQSGGIGCHVKKVKKYNR